MKVSPLCEGAYVVRTLNVHPSNPDKLEILSRTLLSEGAIKSELNYHKENHPKHSVFIIVVPDKINNEPNSF